MPEPSDFKLCQSCCKKESLEIIILIENIAAMAGKNLQGSYPQLNYWGGQTAPKKFSSPSFNPIDAAFYGASLGAYGYTPPINYSYSSNYSQTLPPKTFAKGEMSQDVIIEILRKIKKTNLKLKSSIIIYIYKNGAWVQAILSPKTIEGKNNTITLVHWPYYKSPENDNDPIGVKTDGTLASEANQDYSFSAILSEGRGTPIYTDRTRFFGHQTKREFDTTLGSVRGFNFSSTLNTSADAPNITNKGSFFTFSTSSDTQKIYYSTNFGYVDTSYYQTGEWPVNFGTVTEEDVPSTISSAGIKFWNYEYYPRIPESEKNKILFRDVKVAFADYNDYINKQSDAQDCVPYYNSFDEQTDFPLCYPNCLKDNRDSPQGCPNPSFLRATDATATMTSGGVKSISIDPGLKGVYNCAPTIQIMSNDKSGVGAIAIQKDGQPIPDGSNQLFKPSNSPFIVSKGFGYTTPPEIVYQKVLDEKSIFSENFSSIEYGSNTNIDYSNWTNWAGNENFPSVNNAFEAGGAVYLSGSSSYIKTKNIGLNFPAGNFGISFDVKGRYFSVEPPNNILKIEITGSTDLKTDVSYTSAINDTFQSKYVEFAASTNKNIKFSPAGDGELFLTNIKVYGPGDAAAGYERGWLLRADFTKNFDDIYAAMPYNFLNDYWKFGKGGKGDTIYGFASQGLSAIKNACLKFSQSSKKMIIFVADSFIAYKGTLNDQTNYRADNPVYGASPYPSKEEIKELLSEKNIRLHAIAFNGTWLSYLRDNFSSEYDNLSYALSAYAPANGIGDKLDNNTEEGYVSAIEEITNAKNDLYNAASGNRLWLFSTQKANNANDFERINRDRSYVENGIPSNYQGGRILPQPSTWQDISTGIFYDIKVLLNEIVLPITITPSVNLVYDGNSKPVIATYPDSSIVEFTYSYEGIFSTSYGPTSTAPHEAGDYTVTVTATNKEDIKNTLNFTIQKAVTTLSWQVIEPITYSPNITIAGLNATETNSIPGTITYSDSVVGEILEDTVPQAGTYSLAANFEPNDTRNYTTATASNTLVVNKATPTIVWNDPASIFYETELSAAQLNATASVPGTFIYYPIAGTILEAGITTLELTFYPTDEGNYNIAMESVTLLVNKATAVVNVTDTTKTYDATPKIAEISVDPDGLFLNVTYNGSTEAPTNLGLYYVVATVVDPNYEGEGEGFLLIQL